MISFFFRVAVLYLLFICAGFILRVVIFRKDLGPFNAIIKTLSIIGIAIHEISHAIACILVRVPVEKVSVNEGDDNNDPFGYVLVGEKAPTFSQSLVVGLSPLLTSSLLFYYFLPYLLRFDLCPVYVFLSWFVSVSALIGSFPSRLDFKMIANSFSQNYLYSFYQTALIITSITFFFFFINSKWEILTIELSVPYSIPFFGLVLGIIIIGIQYTFFKYALHGIKKLLFILFIKSKKKTVVDYLSKDKIKNRKSLQKDGQW